MGFLWSMTQAPGQRKGLRLAKKDVTKPYTIQLNCFDGHLSPEDGFVNSLTKNSFQPIMSSTVEKWYMAEGVQRIPVREGRLRGTLFLPPGNGPFPGQYLQKYQRLTTEGKWNFDCITVLNPSHPMFFFFANHATSSE